MSADLRRVLDHGAARPAAPVDVDAVLGRSRQLGRRRGIATVTTIALVVPGAVYGATLATRDESRSAVLARYPGTTTVIAAPGNALPRPAEDEVIPGVLNDGTRVYVVGHDGGEVTVVEAISTHRPFGLQKQIGWCPTAGGFEDVQHGSRWDERGRYIVGPAPRDLATYDVVVDGDEARIGERRTAESRSRGSARGNTWCNGDAQGDGSIASMVFADFPTPAAELVDFDDVAIDQSPRAGVVALDAFVELGGYADDHGPGIAVCGSVHATPDGVPNVCSSEPQALLRAAADATGTGDRIMIGRVRVLLRLHGRLDPGAMLTTADLVRLPGPATFVPGPGGWTASHTFGFTKSVTADGAAGLLTFDEAQFLSGEEANVAAREAGEIGPSEAVPNDYYIRNTETDTLTYPIDAQTEILTLNGAQGLEPTSLEDFARKVNGKTGEGPVVRLAHVFRSADGTVARIVEQYVP